MRGIRQEEPERKEMVEQGYSLCLKDKEQSMMA